MTLSKSNLYASRNRMESDSLLSLSQSLASSLSTQQQEYLQQVISQQEVLTNQIDELLMQRQDITNTVDQLSQINRKLEYKVKQLNSLLLQKQLEENKLTENEEQYQNIILQNLYYSLQITQEQQFKCDFNILEIQKVNTFTITFECIYETKEKLNESDASQNYLKNKQITLNELQRCPSTYSFMSKGLLFKIVRIQQVDFVIFHPLIYSSPTSFQGLCESNLTNKAMEWGTIKHEILQKYSNKSFEEITKNQTFIQIKDELKQINNQMQKKLPESFQITDDEINQIAKNLIKALKQLKSFSFVQDQNYQKERDIKDDILMLKGKIDLSGNTQIVEIKSNISQHQKNKYVQQLTFYFIYQQLQNKIQNLQKVQYKSPHFLSIQNNSNNFEDIQEDIQENSLFYIADIINSRNIRLLREESYQVTNNKDFGQELNQLNDIYQNNLQQFQKHFSNRIQNEKLQLEILDQKSSCNKQLDQQQKQIDQQNYQDKQNNFHSVNSVELQSLIVIQKFKYKNAFQFRNDQWLSQRNDELKNKHVLIVMNQNLAAKFINYDNEKIISYQEVSKYQNEYHPDAVILYKPQKSNFERYCLLLYGSFITYIVGENDIQDLLPKQ